MKNIGFSFDDLPMAVSQLTDKVNSISSMLARHSMPQESPQTEDKLLSVREASTLLRLTVPTIYSKVSRGELPCMKQGNRLYFSLAEITAHLRSGKKRSAAELTAQAEEFCNRKEGGRYGK